MMKLNKFGKGMSWFWWLVIILIIGSVWIGWRFMTELPIN